MASRLSPQADADLEDIAFYVYLESGSVESAERVIQSIAERFDLLDAYPQAVDLEMISGPAYAVFLSAITSFCTASRVPMWRSFASPDGAAISKYYSVSRPQRKSTDKGLTMLSGSRS